MKNDSTIDLIQLLKLSDLSPEKQEIGLREFRIRGIDVVIDELKRTLDKEDKKSLNNHLKMCPGIDCLIEHLQSEYKEFPDIIESYIPKLHKKLSD